MKILQLCRKFPYPLKDGEAIAVTYLAKSYKDLGHDLTLLSFNTIKTYLDIATLPASFNHYEAIHTVYLDNHVKVKDAFLNLFSADSYHITRFINSDFKDKLKELLATTHFDIVQLEGINLAPYISTIRAYSKAKVVMRSHNVEFEIWDRVAENTPFLPKKWYLQYLVKKLKTYEIAQLAHYDLLLAMTQRDVDYFNTLAPSKQIMVAPIGLDLKNYQTAIPAAPPPYSISFIGSLDWMPNQDGLKWFLENVWSVVHKKYPHLEFHIAGRNTPQWVFNQTGKNVIVHGEVEDAKAFIAAHPITVVPLFSGSGMRVKILESMAMGRIILTTAIGVEGIAAQHGQEVFIGNTAQEFIQLIENCLQQPQQLTSMAKRAQVFIVENYDNIQIGKRVIDEFSSSSSSSSSSSNRDVDPHANGR